MGQLWDEKKEPQEQGEEEVESCCPRHLLTDRIPGGQSRLSPCSPRSSGQSQGLVSSPGAGVPSHSTPPAQQDLHMNDSHNTPSDTLYSFPPPQTDTGGLL